MTSGHLFKKAWPRFGFTALANLDTGQPVWFWKYKKFNEGINLTGRVALTPINK